MSDQPLTAIYTSPSTSSAIVFTHPLPPSSTDQTTYVAALRESTLKLQDDINALLTQKMEEDKAVAGTRAVDEAKAEENYGEEGAEEEE